MLLAILAIYFGYKKGKESGRSGALWAVICGVVFIGAQFATAIAIAAVMVIGSASWGWDPHLVDNSQLLITVASLVPAIVAILIIFKYLDRVPDDGVTASPPPPPSFGPPAE
ncbi:MAG: hypothetical protein JO053_04255 [Acidobacteria bacterium]|nr:hypothetical protein [Acidobacteriota bacterium]